MQYKTLDAAVSLIYRSR